MTRKDYALIAEALRITLNGPDTPAPVRVNVIGTFAVALQAENPSFDRVKFVKACV
jgi:hypothetical protein